MTKTNKWSLTPARERLLEMLINPEHLGKNVTELCNLAEISRNSYYKFMNEPEFVELINKTSLDMVKAKMGDVVNATYKYALGEKGHQDRKLLLTMAGLYTDKQEVDMNADINTDEQSEVFEKYLKDVDENDDS